ncbi:hypothetical protein FIBSPDRAFT_894313 [Athelia psychrophila]|uniref:Uncharacterized protein n=1 Tax=Athelia psychrophila TaxID=1759441 RepID=A0A166G213_9AGAM|nr:hypothetical protein FIBSPDRAFT_894313 [Fibularhizoctonia sp. CBS 109695]
MFIHESIRTMNKNAQNSSLYLCGHSQAGVVSLETTDRKTVVRAGDRSTLQGPEPTGVVGSGSRRGTRAGPTASEPRSELRSAIGVLVLGVLVPSVPLLTFRVVPAVVRTKSVRQLTVVAKVAPRNPVTPPSDDAIVVPGLLQAVLVLARATCFQESTLSPPGYASVAREGSAGWVTRSVRAIVGGDAVTESTAACLAPAPAPAPVCLTIRLSRQAAPPAPIGRPADARGARLNVATAQTRGFTSAVRLPNAPTGAWPGVP